MRFFTEHRKEILTQVCVTHCPWLPTSLTSQRTGDIMLRIVCNTCFPMCPCAQVSVLLMLQVLLRGGIHWAEAGFNETARRAAEALVAQIATTELLAPTIATTAAAAGAGTPTAGVEAAASAIAAAAASVGSDVSLTALAVAGYFAVIGAMCVAVLWQPKYTPADTLLYCAVLAPWEALPVLAAIHLYCQYVNSVDLNEA